MTIGLTLTLAYILASMMALVILDMPVAVFQSYAQISSHPLIPNSHSSQSREHIVKITSPSKDQQVTIGKVLTIFGTSTDNTTKDCLVSVIVNGIKPYQNASGNGVRGAKDYSKWSFPLSPNYTTIKQGQNKLTAKFLCANDPNLVAHNSVNVTGVSSVNPVVNQDKKIENNTSAATLLKNASIGENSPANQNVTNPSSNTGSNVTKNAKVGEISNPGSGIGSGSQGANTGYNALSISIHLSKKSVRPGDVQTVSVKVSNANSSSAISGATVLGSITDPSGGSFKKLEGTTDSTGKSSYSWTVSQDDAIGKYETVLDISAPGYVNGTASKTFMVLPVASATSGDTNQFPNPFTGHLHSNLPSTIIPIPHIHMPIIKIPFHLPFH